MKQIVKFLSSTKKVFSYCDDINNDIFRYDYTNDSTDTIRISLYSHSIRFLINDPSEEYAFLQISFEDGRMGFSILPRNTLNPMSSFVNVGFIELIDEYTEEDMSYLILQSDFHKILSNDKIKSFIPRMQNVMDIVLNKMELK